jgi:hypothetical protein
MRVRQIHTTLDAKKPASEPKSQSRSIVSKKTRVSSTRSEVVDSSDGRQLSITRTHRYRFASRASARASPEQTPAQDELRKSGSRLGWPLLSTKSRSVRRP